MLISATSRKLDRGALSGDTVEKGQEFGTQAIAAGSGKAVKWMKRNQETGSTLETRPPAQEPKSICVFVMVFRLRMHVAGSMPAPVHWVA